MGIELATLQSLARRSNQMSYAAAQNHYYLLYKQTFSDESINFRKQFFVTHLHKIVTIFKTSTQKFSIFYFKLAKSYSASGVFALRPPVFLYYSHTALLKHTRRLGCMFLNELIKLCDQLCFSFLKTQIV